MTRFRLGWVAFGDHEGDVWAEGTSEHFLKLAERQIIRSLSLCEIDDMEGVVTRTVAQVQVPEGKLPIFFRRSKLSLNAPQSSPERVTCIGWRDGTTGEGSYVFVRPDGQVIVTDDAFGVLPQ